MQGRRLTTRPAKAPPATSPAHDPAAAYEGSLPPASRHDRGQHFTPPHIVEHLLDHSLAPMLAELRAVAASPSDALAALLSLRVLDPACGPGRFLLAVARRLLAEALAINAQLAHTTRPASAHDAGDLARRIASGCLFGIDTDSQAIHLCRAAIADALRLDTDRVEANLAVDDGLLGPSLTRWARERPFDLVVGNPPFQNQLERRTATDRDRAARLREASADIVRGYADTAAAFLWRSVSVLASSPRGPHAHHDVPARVAMIMPQSWLAARDARPLRRWLADRVTPTHLWLRGERVFQASVVASAIIAEHREPPASITIARCAGPSLHAMPLLTVPRRTLADADTWSILAHTSDTPPSRIAALLDAAALLTLGDVADVTADFRDQYYGLRGAIIDLPPDQTGVDSSHPRLITSGLIDLAQCRWGLRPARVLGSPWQRPAVDLTRVGLATPGTRADRKAGPVAMLQWARARLVPKILLAAQTRTLECVVDEHGRWLPGVPIISIVPRARDSDRQPAEPPHGLWALASAVASPVCCALAVARAAGSALSPDAVKLSAQQVRQLPLPAEHAASHEAARLFRLAQHRFHTGADDAHDTLRASAAASIAAYGIQGQHAADLLHWWLDRATRSPRTARPITPRA